MFWPIMIGSILLFLAWCSAHGAPPPMPNHYWKWGHVPPCPMESAPLFASFIILCFIMRSCYERTTCRRRVSMFTYFLVLLLHFVWTKMRILSDNSPEVANLVIAHAYYHRCRNTLLRYRMYLVWWIKNKESEK